MIDIRSHILDGAPCGPDSFDDSLEMCRAAIADGVKAIVATPRWEAGSSEPPLPFDECRGRLECLEAETLGVISLRLGFVLQFSPDLPALVEAHGPKLALAGGRHLLVSLPSVEVPAEAEGVWSALASAGFSTVLAHPECNAVLRRDDAPLVRWVSEGMTLQIDAMSVLGAHGREVRRFAVECLQKFEGRVVVASNGRWGVDAKNSLAAARGELVRSVGARLARSLMRETPAALIGDSLNGKGGRDGATTRSLTSRLRSMNPLRVLTGESYN
jgi:protein-tyrosine phosphatase